MLIAIGAVVGIVGVLVLGSVALYRSHNPTTGHLSPILPATPATTATPAPKMSYWKLWKWKTRNVFWAIVIVLFCLAFLPQIWGAGIWLIAAIISGPDQLIRGTDRSQWGVVLPRIGQQTTTVPQGKSVGGPLRWNEAATVKLRPRFSMEQVENGVCFFGIIPPATSVGAKFSCYEESKEWYNASLVDFGTSGGKLGPVGLSAHAVSTHHERCVVRKLEGLSGPKRMEEFTINNKTGRTTNEGAILNEMYVQVEGSGAPSTIHMDRKEPTGTFQYVVEVGIDETSFTLPHKNWKWLWIVPVHHEAYQASMDELPVPAEGVSVSEHRNHLGIVASVNGKKSLLDKAILLQPEDSSLSVTVLLNTTVQKIEKGSVKPARIIVGIQL